MWQSTSKVEPYIRKAKQETLLSDRIENLVQAVDELSREVTRLESELRRFRREAQVRRRYS